MLFNHGGELARAAERYQIPREQWLDLSTGINPCGWPAPAIPAQVWQRLPEENDGLMEAAADYYQIAPENLVAVAGSQTAIQALPGIVGSGQVAIASPTYSEHLVAWRRTGHMVVRCAPQQAALDDHISSNPQCRYAVVVNPNNPTGHFYEASAIEHWRQVLVSRGGGLLVDEAFIDATPSRSCVGSHAQPGLVVLRSVGKFFGLAGMRLGFVIAPDNIVTQLQQVLGPWHVSHPARYLGRLALADKEWQTNTRRELPAKQNQLRDLLCEFISNANPAPEVTSGTPLFQSLHWPAQASALFDHLARQGILIRHFPQTGWLRFGLPKQDQEFQRLAQSLQAFLLNG